ncbi:MAG: glycosyltransferase family 2 protein [Chitinophagaceae bacterium]|nr:MAG: glycosyltransferase family 2 protein [Chitinophagaceae bacterium]
MDSKKLLSVVISTFNPAIHRFAQTLQALANQGLNKELWELIVVDNNSTDDTAQLAKDFIASHPQLNARYCFEGNKGLSYARNRGVQEARSPIVNYVDDDALLSPGYLQEMLQFFAAHPQAVGAGGKVIPKYEDGHEPAWMSKYLNGFIGKVDFGEQVQQFTAAMKYPVGCNMAYKKEVLLAAGGFNNALQFRSDDKYIFQQVAGISNQVYYVPKAWLHHYIDEHRLHPENFKKLFLKTGNEEKKRVYHAEGTIGLVNKGIEFLFKFGASVALLLLFMLKGQWAKGKYIFISQYCTLKGFLAREVHVR